MRNTLVIAQAVWIETLRRKDLYVLAALLAALLLVFVSLDIFGVRSMVSYIKEIGLLMTWVFAWILVIGVSVRQLPQEEKSGTIFPLLAKPVTRAELITGKWLGALGVAAASTLVLYILLAGIVAARGGMCNVALMLEAWALHACFMAVVAAMGLLFSTRMNSDAAAALTGILSFAAFALLPRVPELAGGAGSLQKTALMFVYYALPHLELFDLRQRLAHDWEAMPLEPFLMIGAYGILVSTALLALGWLAYRRKMFNRDQM